METGQSQESYQLTCEKKKLESLGDIGTLVTVDSVI